MFSRRSLSGCTVKVEPSAVPEEDYLSEKTTLSSIEMFSYGMCDYPTIKPIISTGILRTLGIPVKAVPIKGADGQISFNSAASAYSADKGCVSIFEELCEQGIKTPHPGILGWEGMVLENYASFNQELCIYWNDPQDLLIIPTILKKEHFAGYVGLPEDKAKIIAKLPSQFSIANFRKLYCRPIFCKGLTDRDFRMQYDKNHSFVTLHCKRSVQWTILPLLHEKNGTNAFKLENEPHKIDKLSMVVKEGSSVNPLTKIDKLRAAIARDSERIIV